MNRRATGLAARAWQAPYLLLTAVALFWAGNSIIGRAVRDTVPPVTLACARWTVAFLVVIGFAWPMLRRDAAALRLHWKSTLALGVTGVGLFNTLLYIGLHYTSATNALLLQASQPALILLLGFALFGQRAGLIQIAGIAIAAAGLMMVVTRADPMVLLDMRFNRGDALILAAFAFWALYSLMLRWRPPVHPLSFLAATFAVGVAFTLPLSAAELAGGARIGDPRIAAAAIAYVGLFPSLIAYLFFNRAVELIGAPAASQFLNLMPLFGAVLAAVLLKEPLGGHHLIGMALILVGILVFSRAPSTHRA